MQMSKRLPEEDPVVEDENASTNGTIERQKGLLKFDHGFRFLTRNPGAATVTLRLMRHETNFGCGENESARIELLFSEVMEDAMMTHDKSVKLSYAGCSVKMRLQIRKFGTPTTVHKATGAGHPVER
jgi:hypothetical protein